MRDERGSISRLGAWLRDNGWKRECIDGNCMHVMYEKDGHHIECDMDKGKVVGQREGGWVVMGHAAVGEFFCNCGKDLLPLVAYLCGGLVGEDDGDGKVDTGGC